MRFPICRSFSRARARGHEGRFAQPCRCPSPQSTLWPLAQLLSARGLHLLPAISAVRESLATEEALLGHDNLEVVDTMEDLVAILPRCGKAAESTALAHEALTIRTNVQGADNPLVVVQSLRIESTELETLGRLDDEETTFTNLLAAQRKLLGEEHPDLAQSLNRLAVLFKREGKLAQSEATRRQALAMQRKFLGNESAEVAQTLSNLGQVLGDENKLSEAETAYRESITLRKKLFGKVDINVAYALAYLGAVLERDGKPEEARASYLEAANGVPSAGSSLAQFNLGQMYHTGAGVRQDSVEAAKWFRKSAELGNRGAQCLLGQMYLEGD